MERELSTQEVADRLGVKPETVYAYVSRGLLTSRRSGTGRGSVFDAKEVEAVARKRRPVSGSPNGVAGITVRTAITLIESDRYYYRGVDAVTLARRYRFEDVAGWLWTGMLTEGVDFAPAQAALTAARNAVTALPAGRGLLDVLRVATVAAAVADPLRFDLTTETVHASARSLIGTLVAAIPVQGPADGTSPPDDAAVAANLGYRLAPGQPDPAMSRCLDAALVLLIDHDLAASTFAARVAASARANPYAVVSAALGALEGPLHGAASSGAHRMLAEALDQGSAATVVAEHLREGRRIPGLGHRLYPREDPRAELLLEIVAGWPAAEAATRMAREIAATAAARAPLYPNIDMALAVLSVSAGMPPDAGECIFAIARTVGWIAHALEEYDERPLRMRPSGQYTGPKPPQPIPG
ncbi:MAG TPA: citrate synthase [Jiangellaceae bacterium]